MISQISLNKPIFTTFVISSVIFHCPGNLFLEGPERLLGDLLFCEVVGDYLIDDSGDMLVSFREILVKLIYDHGPKLLPLLYGLSLLDGRVEFAAFL